jgi:hypothetical protein
MFLLRLNHLLRRIDAVLLFRALNSPKNLFILDTNKPFEIHNGSVLSTHLSDPLI